MEQNSAILACFDIGSGSVKLECTQRLPSGQLYTLRSEQMEVLLGEDLKKDTGQKRLLSEEIRLKSAKAFEHLRDIAIDIGATRYRAIATEVFRDALNGAEHLESLEQLAAPLVGEIRLISQDTEGFLGYRTGLAVAPDLIPDDNDILVWDSGGASFQITGKPPTGRKINAKWGSSTATHAMVSKVQMNDFSVTQSANPASSAHIEATTRMIRNSIIDQCRIPPFCGTLSNIPTIVAIGGETSIFANLAVALGKKVDAPFAFTRCDVLEGLKNLANQSDAKIRSKGFDAQIGMVVPKLCLCYAVLSYLITPAEWPIYYRPTNGVCLGVAGLSEEEWNALD